MKFAKYLSQEQIKQLEYEVLSRDFFIYLTRKLLDWAETAEYAEDIIARKNRIINLSSTISGDKIYILESDGMGSYQQAEYDWHDSNFLLIFRRLNTIQFIEFACELLRAGYFDVDFLNDSLEKEGASFRFINRNADISIDVFNIDEIEVSLR